MADTQAQSVPSVVLTATRPTVVPAQAEATYDRWWLRTIQIQAPTPDAVKGVFTLQKYRSLQDGTLEFSPVDVPVVFTINDILNDSDPAIQQAVGALLTAIQAAGTKAGIL